MPEVYAPTGQASGISCLIKINLHVRQGFKALERHPEVTSR